MIDVTYPDSPPTAPRTTPHRRRRRTALYSALALAVVFAAFVGVLATRKSAIDRQARSPLLGLPAPPIVGSSIVDGAHLDLASLRGRFVLVNFFASWCVPCRLEHPILTKLAGDGVALQGVAYKDKPEDARNWLKALGDPYRRIGQDRDGRTAIEFGVYGVPETYVIDRAGTIRYRQVGPITPADLDTKIKPLLAELKR